MIENNIPQNAKLDYPWAIVPFFGGNQFIHAFPQKAQSSLVHVQES
jgi:hypothetical protein